MSIGLKFTIVVLILFAIGGGSFYWLEFRPSRAVSKCNAEAIKLAQEFAKSRQDEGNYYFIARDNGYKVEDYENYYQRCLRGEGIKM